MSGQLPREDELARRRARKHQPEEESRGDSEPVQLGWKDVLALTIAAYQVLLPILGIIIGVLIVVYLLFLLLFH